MSDAKTRGPERLTGPLAWLVERDNLRRERDEARAEVFRLNAELGRLLTANMARLTEAKCEKEACVEAMVRAIVGELKSHGNYLSADIVLEFAGMKGEVKK